MKPGKIEGATVNLAKPVDWDDERDGKCGSLWVTLQGWPDGLAAFKSAWVPSETELLLLNAGFPVILTVIGSNHPPVSIHVSRDEDVEAEDCHEGN